MCYKQCEIWKCFKTRCRENHQLMGYTASDADTLDMPVAIKEEPDYDENPDEYIEEQEDVYEEHLLSPSANGNDPLDNNSKPDYSQTSKKGKMTNFKLKQLEKKRNKRRNEEEPLSRRSRDVDYTEPKLSPTPTKSMKFNSSSSVSSASHSLYMKTYRDFFAWKTAQGDVEITEKLMLDYFKHLSKNLAPSTLTNKLSHLVKTIQDFHDVSIDRFYKVRQFCRDVRNGGPSPSTSLKYDQAIFNLEPTQLDTSAAESVEGVGYPGITSDISAINEEVVESSVIEEEVLE